MRLSVFVKTFLLLFVTATLCLIQWEATPLGLAIWVASFVLAFCVAYLVHLIAQGRREYYRLRYLSRIYERIEQEKEQDDICRRTRRSDRAPGAPVR